MESILIKKIKQVLIMLSEENSETLFIEFIRNCEFSFTNHWNQKAFPNAFNLKVKVEPNIYAKNYKFMDTHYGTLKTRLNDATELIIDSIEIVPDYNKLQLVNSEIIPVLTEWDEVNNYQEKLIRNLERGTDSIDYQNLGNTARTLMSKIANLVFDPLRHIPEDESIRLNDGDFKNKLHTYIKIELSGSSNKSYRKLADSAITFVERAIDVMNTTTHKNDVQFHFAEMTVISTINAISIIKMINETVS